MAQFFNPYNQHSTKFFKLVTESKKKKNPAWWLYKNDARTVLFMLESICRLCYKATKNRETGKWRMTFKKLEDEFGRIDDYHNYHAELSKLSSVTDAQLDYLEKKKEKALKKMNKYLDKANFFEDFPDLFEKEERVNFNNRRFLLRLEREIKIELFESNRFFHEHPLVFTSMEEQVHNLRRKLRWISIYSLSLNGIITLKDPKQKYSWEKKYITKAVVNSPYNKVPAKKELAYNIVLNRKAFYALSYVIDKLGTIKDKGIALIFLAKAIEKTSSFHKGESLEKAFKEIHPSQSMEKLLASAHSLLNEFFNKYKIHHLLTRVR